VLDLGENTFELPRFGKALDVQPDGKVLLSLGATLKRLDGKSGALDPTFGVNGVENNTGQLIGIGSGGSIIAATIPDDGSSATLERRFADEGPVGLLSARAISSVPTVPYKFVVQWRDDDGVDPSSLLSGLQIIGPDGNTYRAHLLGTIAENANALFAVYKFTAPGGSWSAIDNGTYTVRVRSAKVKDSNAVATPAGNLGTFTVAI
jgi:hypothetical protein